MNSRCAALNNLCRAKLWKVLQPKAGALGFGMSELPRLDALRKLDIIPYQVLRMRMHDWVLDADVRDRRIPEVGEKFRTLAKILPHLVNGFAGWRLVQPSHAAVAEAGAGWMGDDQKIPAVVQDFPYVALDMAVAVVLGGKQITRPCVVAFLQKRVAHDT